jgi:toxin-antitoxin system PIN domain toxin
VKLVDLNILLYAINRDSAHHERIRRWWENALGGDEPVGLAWVVLLGFLRLATNPRVFPSPLAPEDALERVYSWLNHANTRVVTETEDQWLILRGLISESGTSGNLTTDAHLASLAIANGATLVSCDTDFARFSHLRWENPAATP